ncbi:MAG: hypothetical protein AMS23_07625, partial [Bacteroides sp. SM1_62]
TRRIIPGTGIGTDPDLLGSSRTANNPQINAAITGIPKVRSNRNQVSLCRQPQIPMVSSADISSRNRTARFIGFDPIAKT